MAQFIKVIVKGFHSQCRLKKRSPTLNSVKDLIKTMQILVQMWVIEEVKNIFTWNNIGRFFHISFCIVK